MQQQEDTYQIPNAAHWLPHSHVLIKEDFTAGDDAWVQNQLTKVEGVGTKKPDMQMLLGNIRILTVQRMVTSGIVAVQRKNGRVKTVQLPAEADKLLKDDLDYIFEQIDANNADMSPEEQKGFLHSANGRSEDSLKVVK